MAKNRYRQANSVSSRDSLEQPCHKGSVEPVATLLASVCKLLLGLVCQESLLFAVDLVLASVKVGLVWLDALRLHEELVAEDAYEVDRDTLFSASVGD